MTTTGATQRGPRVWWWLPAVAICAVLLVYHRALGFDLLCDDWLVFRPWSTREVLATWHGTWEPQHAWAVFYRPLASALYAALFEIFGVNAPALMAVSMAWLIGLAWMLGVFVRRETHSSWVAAVAVAIYAAHPNGPWSGGVWLTNDLHKLALQLILATLLYWQYCRSKHERTWWPLGLCVTTAFLVKEDSLMLIPALLLLQAGRARWMKDVCPPSMRLIACGVALGAALLAWRHAALGEVGGFDWPNGVLPAVSNLLRGPYYVLTGKASLDSPHYLMRLLAGGVTLTALAVVVGRMRRDRQWWAVQALVLIACFDAPLVLVSGPTRYYALTAGCAMLFAAVTADLWHRAQRPAFRAGFAVAVAVVLAASGVIASRTLDRQSPCGAGAFECIEWTIDAQPLLAPELRAHILALPRMCQAATHAVTNRSTATIVWGLVDFPECQWDSSATFSWTAERVVALVPQSAGAAVVRLRHPGASSDRPVDVELSADGSTLAPVRLTSGEWTDVRVPFSPGLRVWLRARHRIDLRVAAASGLRSGVEMQPVRLP